MNKFTSTILFFSILLTNSFHSKAQSFLWANTGNYGNYSHFVTFKKDHTGDFYFVTYNDSFGQALTTRLEKKTAAMTDLWSVSFSGSVQIVDVEINSLNHAIVTGYYEDTLVIAGHVLVSQFHNSAFIFEAEETGNITWAVNFNPTTDEFRPVDLFVDKNDEIYLTAQTSGVHKFCSFHHLDVWGNPIRDEFNDADDDRTFSHILVDNSGNVYISGTCGNFAVFDSLHVTISDSYQNMLLKYDANFNAQWVISRPYVTFDDNNSLVSDGQYLYWAFNQAGAVQDSIRLTKFDYNGQIQSDVPGPLGSAFFPLITYSNDTNGTGILVANVYSHLFVYRYDNQFNLLSEDTIYSHLSGSPAQEQVICEDSTFYISAKYWGDSLQIGSLLLRNPNSGTGDYDIFLTKWGYATSGIENMNSESDISYYPNPANEKLYLNHTGNENATIQILDCFGQICTSQKTYGRGRFEFDLTNLASGIYFLRFEKENSNLNSVSRFVVNH